jgi:hypothetical protein
VIGGRRGRLLLGAVVGGVEFWRDRLSSSGKGVVLFYRAAWLCKRSRHDDPMMPALSIVVRA